MRRRTALTALVALGVAVLLGSYVVYTQGIVRELRAEAQKTSQIVSRVFAGRVDPSEDAALLALTDITAAIVESDIPLVVTERGGYVTQHANLPPAIEADSSKWTSYIVSLDAENAPVTDSTTGVTVHYGPSPLIRGLRVIPILQSSLMFLLLVGGVALLLTHGRAEREHMWAGMARESAHQIGTPLSSLHGWIELLSERSDDPMIVTAIGRMRADMERLERVAHRFERIGRPPKTEPVEVSGMVGRVVDYFRDRVPTLTTPVHFKVELHDAGLTVAGDRVLLEWVLESLIKNSIDALSGVGGTITVTADALPEGQVRIRVADDGPGVPSRLRSRIFDAGFTTKERGWGIGLALTRRIVHENHGGKLVLVPTTKGAMFDVILPS